MSIKVGDTVWWRHNQAPLPIVGRVLKIQTLSTGKKIAHIENNIPGVDYYPAPLKEVRNVNEIELFVEPSNVMIEAFEKKTKARGILKKLLLCLPFDKRNDANTQYRIVGELSEALLDEDLNDCSSDSIYLAIRGMILIGLPTNTVVRKYSIVVSRWSKKAEESRAILQMTRDGWMFLYHKLGYKVRSGVVFECDKWTQPRMENGEHKFSHIESDDPEREKKQIVFAYCYLWDRDGHMMFTKAGREDIRRSREKSDGYLKRDGTVNVYSPWHIWPDRMAEKTALIKAHHKVDITQEVLEGLQSTDYQAAIEDSKFEARAAVVQQQLPEGRSEPKRDELVLDINTNDEKKEVDAAKTDSPNHFYPQYADETGEEAEDAN